MWASPAPTYVPGLAGAGPYAPLPLPALEPDYRVAKPRWELLTRFEAEVQSPGVTPVHARSALTRGPQREVPTMVHDVQSAVPHLPPPSIALSLRILVEGARPTPCRSV